MRERFWANFGLCASATGAVFALFAMLHAWIVLHTIQAPIILSFTNRNGITARGTLFELELRGFAGLVMIAINLALVRELKKKDIFWERFIAAVTLLLGLLLFVGFEAIISVN
jgi:hypothetical protein